MERPDRSAANKEVFLSADRMVRKEMEENVEGSFLERPTWISLQASTK
jgi:hypothetical protein